METKIDDEKYHQDHAKLLQDLFSVSYDKAVLYTNTIIAVGYVGGFSILSFAKEQLSPLFQAISGLMLSISVAFFVFFEIYKMIINTATLEGMNKVLSSPTSETFYENLQIQNLKDHSRKRKLFKIWRVVLAITVSTALIFLLIIGGAFVLPCIDQILQSIRDSRVFC